MTKRKRISKKAQRRRYREWEYGALWRMKFDTFYGVGYWYVAGHSGERLGLDIKTEVPALEIYIAKPGGMAFPAKPIDDLLDRAISQIQGLPRSFGEKRQAVQIYTRMVLMSAESGVALGKER